MGAVLAGLAPKVLHALAFQPRQYPSAILRQEAHRRLGFGAVF